MKTIYKWTLLGALAIVVPASADHKAPEWMKYTVPAENHALLKDLVGTWSAKSKWWMSPTAAPEESTGTNTNKLILGGRFLQSDFKGKADGQPFVGMGLLGYNSFKEEYESTWIDTMGTAIVVSAGKYDPATKTITQKGSFADPMTGTKNKEFRDEWKFDSKNAYSYFMYSSGADGKEYKALEISYRRK